LARAFERQIISAVVVGNLGTCSAVLDGAYDDLVAYRAGLGIGPARVVCIAPKVLSARSVNRPTTVDLIKIAAASGFKSISLLVRQLAAFVFDNERSCLNWRCCEKAQASAGTADTESSLAAHITHVRRFALGSHLGGASRPLNVWASHSGSNSPSSLGVAHASASEAQGCTALRSEPGQPDETQLKSFFAFDETRFWVRPERQATLKLDWPIRYRC
jgi:hypothetical protein